MNQPPLDMRILLPSRTQRSWGWPVIANMFLGGTGSGFYLVLLAGTAHQGLTALRWQLEICALGLVAAGFMLQALEVGRPGRLHRLWRNPHGSWISREFLFAAVFFSGVLLHLATRAPFLQVLAGLGAAGLLVSQGCILYQAKAIRFWNRCTVPLSSALSGMTSGYGLALLFVSDMHEQSVLLPAAGLALVLLNLAGWFASLAGGEKEEEESNLTAAIWVGQLLAAGLLGVTIFVQQAALAPIAGVLLLGSVLAQKIHLLRKARLGGIYLDDKA